MYVAEKAWLFWCAVVRRMPSDREHEFSQGGKSTSYEHVCLVTANSGFRSAAKATGDHTNRPPSPSRTRTMRVGYGKDVERNDGAVGYPNVWPEGAKPPL